MAISGLDTASVAQMNAKEREHYFMNYAGYFPDSPNKPYAIRVGSKTFFDKDTYELRQQFERYAKNLKRRKAYR